MIIDLTKFKDINDVEIIPIDFTLYFFIITACILIFSFVLYLLRKKKIVKLTKKDLAYQQLKNINFKSLDTKKVIYDFTIYGKESLEENQKEKFEEILHKLKPYKYKKENKSLDDNLIQSMQSYILWIEQCKH